MGLQLGEFEMGDTFYFVRLSLFSPRIEAARVWKKQFPFGFFCEVRNFFPFPLFPLSSISETSSPNRQATWN